MIVISDTTMWAADVPSMCTGMRGLIDAQMLPAWRSTDASLADFGGMPSSMIEGTYRLNNMTLNTSRRNVIATSGPDKYLVSLSVTTSAQVSVAAGAATDAIVNGFRVTSPDAPAPPPAADGCDPYRALAERLAQSLDHGRLRALALGG